jgi:DNA-binding PadR family transcriptional regulator
MLHNIISPSLSFTFGIAVLNQILAEQTSCIETLPSLAEIVVLHVIDNYQPVSGYQIRKKFTEITNKRLSFGTLVPMLHRFEKSGLAIRTREGNEETAVSYNWFLTPYGSRELTSRLELLGKMLGKNRRNTESFQKDLVSPDAIKEPIVVSTPETY